MFAFEYKIISLEILRQVHKFIVKNFVIYLFKPCQSFCPDMLFIYSPYSSRVLQMLFKITIRLTRFFVELDAVFHVYENWLLIYIYRV